jgi:hypothetical protein
MQDSPKFTQIWIFGLKINRLATLHVSGQSGKTADTAILISPMLHKTMPHALSAFNCP